jgi:hypothetical protein
MEFYPDVITHNQLNLYACVTELSAGIRACHMQMLNVSIHNSTNETLGFRCGKLIVPLD